MQLEIIGIKKVRQKRTISPKIFQLHYKYNRNEKQCQDVLKKIFLCRIYEGIEMNLEVKKW